MGAITYKITNNPEELAKEYNRLIAELRERLPKVITMLEKEHNRLEWELQPWYKTIFRKNPYGEESK